MKTIKIAAYLVFAGTTGMAQNPDINFLRSVNADNSASWDNVNKLFSRSVTPVSIAAPLSMFLSGIFWHDSTAKGNSYVMTASLLADGIVTVGLKYSIRRTRPFVAYPFIIKKSEAGSYSFPSGHTSLAFADATSLSLAYPKWYVIAPSFLWASVVGYSRMELGVHYPSDVFAGALIGAGCSWIIWKVNKQIVAKKK